MGGCRKTNLVPVLEECRGQWGNETWSGPSSKGCARRNSGVPRWRAQGSSPPPPQLHVGSSLATGIWCPSLSNLCFCSSPGLGGELASETKGKEVKRCHLVTKNVLVSSKVPWWSSCCLDKILDVSHVLSPLLCSRRFRRWFKSQKTQGPSPKEPSLEKLASSFWWHLHVPSQWLGLPPVTRISWNRTEKKRYWAAISSRHGASCFQMLVHLIFTEILRQTVCYVFTDEEVVVQRG